VARAECWRRNSNDIVKNTNEKPPGSPQWVDATLSPNPLALKTQAEKSLARLNQPERNPSWVFTGYNQTDRFLTERIIGSTD
jgi:hypothetical protein